MIIWGSKMRYKTLGEGEFYCPRCAATRRYLHKSARRFFTLYFIPLIPMKDMGELSSARPAARPSRPPCSTGRPHPPAAPPTNWRP